MRSIIPLALLLTLAACTRPSNPDELREKTANATQTLKTDAKAVASGIKDGLKRNDVVNINKASREDLQKLPGIDDAAADRIIAGRPYTSSPQLVRKRIISQKQYDAIAGKITAQQ
jgi:DNA uptake protein ComE-like DNA-binding protein